MKKIKSIKQLKAEKERINRHLEDLESRMYRQWNELKHNLTPSGLIKDTFKSAFTNKAESSFNGENIAKAALAFGVSMLVNRFAKKAGKKFSTLFTRKKRYQETEED